MTTVGSVKQLFEMHILNEVVASKDVVILTRIFKKILENPENKQYQNISINRIKNKFIHPNLCINILYYVGFSKSHDEKRLLYNIEQLSELNNVYNELVSIYKVNSSTIKWNDMTRSTYLLQSSGYSSNLLSTNNTLINCNLDDCLCIEIISNILLSYRQYLQQCHSNTLSTSQYPEFHDIVYSTIGNNYGNVDLLDDFNHILSYHSNDFEDIYSMLCAVVYENKPCDFTTCIPMKRNQRNRSLIAQNEQMLSEIYLNQDNIIEQQLLDRIHCHLFHTFDIGYKITQNEKEQIINNFDCKLNCIHTDMIATQINKMIKVKQESRRNVEGLDRLNFKAGKFMTHINTLDEAKEQKLEEYSYGYRFFYWDYYKNNNELTDRARRGVNDIISQFSSIIGVNNDGRAVKDWFVAKKYNTFQDEMLNNDICCIGWKQWNKLLQKAQIHNKTNLVKEIKCKRTKSAECYSMFYGFKMQLKHLIALMVYCNFDKLQKRFSETFRKMHINESINSVKSRHQYYHHLAKNLRECVECFGMNSLNMNNNLINVYHGIN
eukprot:385127_1